MKRKTRKWCSHFPAIEHLESSGLSLDIKYLIVDHLSHKDIRNVLAALGWQIPDQYWRSRISKDIVSEIEELDSTADVAWQVLCLRAEQLLEKLAWTAELTMDILSFERNQEPVLCYCGEGWLLRIRNYAVGSDILRYELKRTQSITACTWPTNLV